LIRIFTRFENSGEVAYELKNGQRIRENNDNLHWGVKNITQKSIHYTDREPVKDASSKHETKEKYQMKKITDYDLHPPDLQEGKGKVALCLIN
jgi:hypothetical protein